MQWERGRAFVFVLFTSSLILGNLPPRARNMGTSRLNLKHHVRLNLNRAERELKARGIRIIITSTFRSIREQTLLFQNAQRGLSKFPVARPGFSTHQLGIAVDLVPEDPDDLPTVVEVMRAVGFRWAGERDRVHFTFQLTPEATEQPLRGPLRVLRAPSGTRTPPSKKISSRIPIACIGDPCCF